MAVEELECVPHGHILEDQRVEEREGQHSPGFLLIPFLFSQGVGPSPLTPHSGWVFLSLLNLSGNIFTDMPRVVYPR